MADASGALPSVVRAGPAPEKSNYPPLLFIHGAFVGAWTWEEHFLEFFAERGFSCHAINLPGRKGMPDHKQLHDFGIEDFVTAVNVVVDELPRPPVLVGHSMGGFIAQRVAMSREIAGAVLLSTVPPTGLAGPSVMLAMSKPMLLWEIAAVQSFGTTFNLPETLHEAIFDDHVPREISAKLLPKFQMESQRAVIELNSVLFPPIGGLRGKPVLVLGAEWDKLIPTAFVHGTAAFLGTQAHIFERMGHAVMLEEHWKEAAAFIADWLGEHYG